MTKAKKEQTVAKKPVAKKPAPKAKAGSAVKASKKATVSKKETVVDEAFEKLLQKYPNLKKGAGRTVLYEFYKAAFANGKRSISKK